MEILYRSKKLRKVCTDANVARKEYGDEMARKIHQRIDAIKAADTVEILVQGYIGRCHLLTGNRAGQYAMDLVHPYRLVFIKIGQEIQIARIQEIIDYHR